MTRPCQLRTLLSFLFVLGSTACVVGPREGHAQSPKPSQDLCPPGSNQSIVSAMYFMSRPQDAAQCSMSAREDGQISIPPALSNPAMSCPDMFSWKLFASAVRQEFWKGWAADQQTWPGVSCTEGDTKCTPYHPLPLCSTSGAVPGQCCDAKSLDNPGYDNADNPAIHCPYFPGDHVPPQGVFPLRLGQPPSKAHLVSFAASPEARQALRAAPLKADDGRKIRQSMAEIVFRNKPMFGFVFQNNLYHQEGISAVFRVNNENIARPGPKDTLITGMPYRLRGQTGALSEIDFPVESIMIKSNWVAQERAKELGLKEDPHHPYIKMTISSAVTDNNGTILLPGVHWLVAFHISSKDTPNWVWTTFEHVNNPGRCDYTGCNDSYGYTSPDTVKSGQATNYTQPNMQCDDLLLSSNIFKTGDRYAGGKISEGLADLLGKLRIGLPHHPTDCQVKGPNNQTLCMPSPEDTGWRSYRLKGAQVNFTDSMGRPTRLGNSVTEGGFVNTSSCIGCHARAGTTQQGTSPPALGVFVNELSETGYGQSHFGIPVADWYHHSGQPPRLNVLQTDFVWGFLAANPFDPKSPPPGVLMSTPLQAPVPAPASVRGRIGLPGQ